MKAVLLLALFAAVAGAISPGQNQFSTDRPEGARTWYVWVPQSYFSSSTNFPVVFGFHGLGDECTDFAQETGFISVAEANNFLYVYPCGWPGLIGNAWNAGTCCLNPSSIDDVQFTHDMISYLQKNFRVNSKQIFTSGFSNGAMMSEILVCKAADAFAGAASVSGCVELDPGNDGGLAACDEAFGANNHSVPLLHVHGDGDFVVPWTGDAILGFPTTPTDFSRWGQRQGCQGDPVDSWTRGHYSSQVYNHCPNGITLELVKNSGGGHEWPIDQYFNTTAYVWQFFSNIIGGKQHVVEVADV